MCTMYKIIVILVKKLHVKKFRHFARNKNFFNNVFLRIYYNYDLSVNVL